MKKLAFLLLAIASLALPARAGDLSKADTTFLASCEKVRAALVDNDLALARETAATLDGGTELASSKSLADARAAFALISVRAVKLAAGEPGYFIFHCPMLNLDWVQTSDTPGNPFGGDDMRACGVIKK